MHTSPETTEAFEHFRENFFRQRGIWLPTPALLKDSVDSTSGRQLRILLLDAEGQEGRSIDVPGTSRERLDRSMAVLNEEVSRATLAWVDAEQAGALAKDERIGKVLDTLNISVTDLKLLLRAVLSPRPEDAAGSAPNSASIRDSDWLLPSLVFWKAYYEDENAPKLAELLPDLAQGMRRLQAQRYATPGAAKSGDALTAIETGIGAVEAGQLDRAAALFGRALHMGGRDEIEKLFVERYAARWQADRRRRMTSACTEPTAGKLDESLRIDVEAFLQEPQAKKDAGTARNLALCLLSSMSPTVPKAKSALRLKIAGEYGVPEQWPASQAGWLATHLFEEYDPVRESEDVLDAGTRFMNAAVRRLPAKDAASLVNGLRDICLRPGPNNWCWPLLEAANEIRPDPWASLDVALALAAQESIGEVKSALPWVERARGLFSHESRTTRQQRDRFNFWSEYIPAEVSYAVGVMTGNEADFAEARRHLSGLLSAPAIKDDPSLEVRAVVLAVHVLMDGANPERDRAEEIRHAASESARTDAGSLSRTLFEGLRDGDVATVLRIVKQASDAAAHTPHTDTDSASNEKRADALFLAAIGGLLTDPEHTEWEARQFMTTGHVYAPLVSMLLMARMHGQARDDAQGLMEERWARIDPTTWDKRLRLGDRTAWYEMLLGYFAGKVPAGDIFDPLRNESTLAASRFAGLHVNRRALLTEARFYDAVRQMAKDETDGASASLKQVVDLGYKQYIEYDMAVYLQRSPIGLPVHHSDAAIPQASK